METFDYIQIEFEQSIGQWVTLPDVLQRTGINCRTGMRGSDVMTRIAEAGEMTFTLRNDAGCSGGLAHYYTPGHTNCLTGWGVGKKIRLVIGWQGGRFVVWQGRIVVGGITIDADLYVPTVRVTARDYMEDLSIHEIKLPAFTTNKKIDEITTLLIDNMPVKPQNTQYAVGSTTFEAVFDTVTTKTRAIQELNKVALSELGYVYLRHDPLLPETLTVESRNTRSSLALAELNQHVSADEEIETEVPANFETEDSQIIYMETVWNDILSGSEEAAELVVFRNAGRDVRIISGEDYLNYLKITSYPRETDASDVTLFTLNSPINIAAGETIIVQGSFKDPDAKASSVTGRDMLTPVAGTHYNMSSSESPDSGDMNANCVLSRVYGTNGFQDTITNTAASDAYITRLLAVGKGIYIYEPVDTIIEDAGAIYRLGKQQWLLDCKYLDDPLVARDYGEALRSQLFTMRTQLAAYTYFANKSFLKAEAFLTLTIGDKIHIVEDSAGISQDYIIQGKDWVIGQGGVTLVQYILRDATLDTFAYWLLDDAAQSQLDSTTILGF